MAEARSCRKKQVDRNPVRRAQKEARTARRKDANVKRSSHGKFSSVAQLLAHARSLP